MNSRSRVATSSAEVASSRIRIRGSRTSARARHTAWRSLSGRLPGDRPEPRRVDQLGERLAASLPPLLVAEAPLEEPVAPQPDVRQDPLLGDHQDLLEYGRDPERLSLAGGTEIVDLHAGQFDLARVRPVHTRQDLHERALAGGVLPHDRQHLAAAQFDGAVAQRLGRTERLGDVLDPEDDIARPGRRRDGRVVSCCGHKVRSIVSHMLGDRRRSAGAGGFRATGPGSCAQLGP